MIAVKWLTLQLFVLGALFTTAASAFIDGDHSLKQSTDHIDPGLQTTDLNDPPPDPPNPDFDNHVIYQAPSIPNSHQESPSSDSHRLNSPVPSPPTSGSRLSRSVNLQRPSSPNSHQDSHSPQDQFSPVPSPLTSGSRLSRSDTFPNPQHNVQVPNGRFKRDASKSSQLYTRASIIARMANGVALQAGLMDGSIKMDDVLPELLHLGKIKVSEVAAFKSEPLTKFINEVKSMPQTLNAVQELLDLEDETVAWNEIRKAYESLPDFQTYPIGNKFFADVSQFVKLSPYQGAHLIENGFTELLTFLDEIETQKSQGTNAMYSPFETFDSKYKRVCEAFGNITEIHKGLLEEPNFVRSLSELKHVDNFIRIVKSKKGKGMKKQTIDRMKPLLKKEFDELKKLKTSSSSAEKEVQLLASVADSRYNSQRTSRKVTSGFSNGLPDVLQLSNDTSNSWIEKVLSVQGDVQTLGKGLRPLIKNMERVGPVDSNLRTLSNPDLFRAILDFAQIQKQISTLHPSLADYSTIFDESFQCGKKSKVDISKIESIVNIAKNLAKGLEKPRTSLPTLFNFDLTGFKKKMDEFIKNWGFSNMKNLGQVQQELPKVLANLSDTKIAEVRITITAFSQNITNVAVVGVIEFNGLVKKLTAGQTLLANFFNNDAPNEKDVLTCLQKIKEKSEAAANGIYLIRNLRSQDSKAIGNVESAVTAFSQASKALPALNSVPSDMKKDTNSHVTDLNNMTDAKTSQTIGESVNSLRAAVGLKKLEPKVAELRSVDGTVHKDLSNMASAFEKQTIEKIWENHQKEMKSLEAGIEKAAEFDRKLDVPKARRIRAAEFESFEDYGKALSGVANIPDVDFNAEKKEKNLDIRIRDSKDPQAKSVFEKTKSIMHDIAGLDLKFSKHKTSLEGAPLAFKKFHDHLVAFIAKKTKEDEDERNAAKIEEKKPEWPLFAGIGIGGLIVLLIVGIILLIILKKLFNPLTLSFKNDKVANCDDFFKHCDDNFKLICNPTGIKRKGIQFPKGHCRDEKILCNPKSAIKLEKDGTQIPIHANPISTDGFNRFIATQAPLPDTIPLFLEMALNEKSKSIVMLCKWEEADRYFDDKLEGEMTFGNFTVKTMASKKIIGGLVTETTLLVTEKGGQSRSSTIVHYQLDSWPEMGAPKDPDVIYQLLKLVISEDPVIVHCSNGVGRTCVFIGIQYLVDKAKCNPRFLFTDCLINLESGRWQAMQTVEQVMYMLVAYRYCISKEKKIFMTYYKKYLKYYKEHLDKNGKKSAQSSGDVAL